MPGGNLPARSSVWEHDVFLSPLIFLYLLWI